MRLIHKIIEIASLRLIKAESAIELIKNIPENWNRSRGPLPFSTVQLVLPKLTSLLWNVHRNRPRRNLGSSENKGRKRGWLNQYLLLRLNPPSRTEDWRYGEQINRLIYQYYFTLEWRSCDYIYSPALEVNRNKYKEEMIILFFSVIGLSKQQVISCIYLQLWLSVAIFLNQ